MRENVVGLCQPPGIRMIVGLGDRGGWCVLDGGLLRREELKLGIWEMNDSIADKARLEVGR